MKSFRASLRETLDKRPLGRDPDKGCCHRQTSVKLFWSQAMAPWTSRQHAGKVKSSRPSLRETGDKKPLGRDPGRS